MKGVIDRLSSVDRCAVLELWQFASCHASIKFSLLVYFNTCYFQLMLTLYVLLYCV